MYKTIETWEHQYQAILQSVIREAKMLGADQAEVIYTTSVGWFVVARDQSLESVQQHQGGLVVITVYITSVRANRLLAKSTILLYERQLLRHAKLQN